MSETVERRLESVFLSLTQCELRPGENHGNPRQTLRWNRQELL